MSRYDFISAGVCLGLALLPGCGGSSNPTGGNNEVVSADPVSGLSVADVANNGTGQDLQISFNRAADEAKVGEYRIIVSKSVGSASVTLSSASALTAGQFTAAAKTACNISKLLGPATSDRDGDPLTEEVAYRVYVLTVADGVNATRNALSLPSSVITLSSTAQPVANLRVRDTANNGDGADIRINFDVAGDESSVSSYRVILVKSSDAASFDTTAANAVSLANYTGLAKTGASIEATLTADTRDKDGAVIVQGTAYRAFALSVADGTVAIRNALSSPTSEFTLAKTNLVVTLTDVIQAGSGGLAVDKDGNIFAADFGNSLSSPPGTRVFKITPEGEVSLFATGLVGASGNAFDSQGNLFQSNIGGGFISKITPDGQVTTFSNSGFASPVGIAIDSGDTLYVANCGNNTIRKVTPGGVSTPFASGSLFSCPNGIALAGDGNLYVANFGNGRVIRVASDGSSSIHVTLPGGNNGHISFANGVLYVVARAANQIYEVTLDGVVTLLAGSGQRGLEDGAALDATLSLTNDVVIDPTGKILYFNDVTNLAGTNIISPIVIRKVLLDAED